MQTTFRSPYFALLETYAPQLLAGPEGRAPQPKAAQTLATGQVGVFGVLGQNDWFADSDYSAMREFAAAESEIQQ
jgi:hypothetical protein